MRRKRLRLAVFSSGSTATALRASEPMAQAQSADATCWVIELAGILDGMYTPYGYIYPMGLSAVKSLGTLRLQRWDGERFSGRPELEVAGIMPGYDTGRNHLRI